MTVFPGFIFAFLAIVSFALVVGFFRSIARLNYLAVAMFGVFAVPFVGYFAHAIIALSVPRAPETVFQYALGFAPPSGVADLIADERKGLHPGADIFLRFNAPDEALLHILAQARFKPVAQSAFAEALIRRQQPHWWRPAANPPRRFWHSRDFAGPYTFHNAYLAQSADLTTWAFVTAFE